jgi:DNA-binding response OmpR family regulator
MTASPTILVVDDEPELCDVLKKVLTKEGYCVLIATSGHRGLSLLKKEKDIRLILLDLKMPAIDGLDLLKKMKKSWGRRKRPAVIILTAYGSLSSAREAMELGAVDYLTKPFDLKDVKRAVKEALGGG